METVYLIQRTDYEDCRYEDGTTDVLGIFAFLKEANETARSEVEGEKSEDDDEDSIEESGGDGSPLTISILDSAGEFSPSRSPRRGAHKVIGSKPSPSKKLAVQYGHMMPIPVGKPDVLSGKKFFTARKLETLSQEALRATVYAYGKQMAASLSKADYFVAGIGSSTEDQAAADRFGDRKFDEAGFFKLVQNGGPGNLQNGAEAHDAASVESSEPPPAKRVRIEDLL